MNLVEMVFGNVDRITFIQNSDQWLVFVNKVMSLSVGKKRSFFLLCKQLSVFKWCSLPLIRKALCLFNP